MAVIPSDHNTLVVANLAQTLQFKQRMDNSGPDDQPVYIGVAAPGSLETEAVWMIRQLSYDGNGAVEAVDFAESQSEFRFVWDDRALYTYG